MEVGKIYLVVFLCQFGITYVTATDRECSAFCVLPDTGLACDNITGDCLHGCQPGYAGSKCNVQCCSNCNDCTLNQGSVTAIVCNGCAKNYYLSDGNCKPCSDNCAENDSSSASVCRQTDGRCEFGCVEGYYGDTCMSRCSATCHGNTCDSDGSCANECSLPVLTGRKCMDSCSEGCVKRECSQIGTCLEGCTTNYWNSDCQTPCSAYCHKPLDLDTRVCNVSTGFCLHGCINNTFWDTNCTSECSTNCANQKCDFMTGDCTDGCVDEFEGPKCSERKKPDTDTIMIVIGVIIGAFVIVIICILFIVCSKRKRNK